MNDPETQLIMSTKGMSISDQESLVNEALLKLDIVEMKMNTISMHGLLETSRRSHLIDIFWQNLKKI